MWILCKIQKCPKTGENCSTGLVSGFVFQKKHGANFIVRSKKLNEFLKIGDGLAIWKVFGPIGRANDKKEPPNLPEGSHRDLSFSRRKDRVN